MKDQLIKIAMNISSTMHTYEDQFESLMDILEYDHQIISAEAFDQITDKAINLWLSYYRNRLHFPSENTFAMQLISQCKYSKAEEVMSHYNEYNPSLEHSCLAFKTLITSYLEQDMEAEAQEALYRFHDAIFHPLKLRKHVWKEFVECLIMVTNRTKNTEDLKKLWKNFLNRTINRKPPLLAFIASRLIEIGDFKRAKRLIKRLKTESGLVLGYIVSAYFAASTNEDFESLINLFKISLTSSEIKDQDLFAAILILLQLADIAYLQDQSLAISISDMVLELIVEKFGNITNLIEKESYTVFANIERHHPIVHFLDQNPFLYIITKMLQLNPTRKNRVFELIPNHSDPWMNLRVTLLRALILEKIDDTTGYNHEINKLDNFSLAPISHWHKDDFKSLVVLLFFNGQYPDALNRFFNIVDHNDTLTIQDDISQREISVIELLAKYEKAAGRKKIIEFIEENQHHVLTKYAQLYLADQQLKHHDFNSVFELLDQLNQAPKSHIFGLRTSDNAYRELVWLILRYTDHCNTPENLSEFKRSLIGHYPNESVEWLNGV